MTNELVKKFIAECDVKKLREEAETNISIEIMNNEHEEGHYSAYLGDIVSGSYGQYQAEKICEYFGIEYKNDFENDWYDIDSISSSIADELIVLTGLQGNFYFGHLEYDGSYGLFYILEKEGEE